MAKAPGPAQLTPVFKLVFITAAVLTVLSLAVCVCLAVALPKDPSDAVKQLMETCTTTWKIGFGAIIGLIGGKVT